MSSASIVPSIPAQSLLSRSGPIQEKISLKVNTRKASLQLCYAAQPATLATVQKLVAHQLSVDESTVVPEAKFADLKADSLDLVEIIQELEDKFTIEFPSDAKTIHTVQDAADTVQDLLDNK